MPALVPPPYRTPGAISDDGMAYLRQRSAVSAYLSVVPLSALTATARIASSNNFTNVKTLTNINIDRKSDNWGSVADDMTVAIGTTAGAADIGLYRIRATDNDTILKIGETGIGDPGLRPLNKSATIAADNYVTVYLVDRNIWAALTRITYSGTVATFYKDYDEVYTGQNQYAPATLKLGEHLACFVDPGQTYATVDFRPRAETWAVQPTSYNYILPSGATVVSGSAEGSISLFTGERGLTEAWLTVRLPVGFHVVRMAVAQSGVAAYITNVYRFIWVHDTTTFPPYSVSSYDLTKDRVGWDINCTLVGDDIANRRISSVVQFWKVAYWNDQQAISTGNRSQLAATQYTGWIGQQSYAPGENGTRNTNITIGSATRILDRLPTSSLSLTAKQPGQNPDNWQDCIPDLCNAEYWTWYILRWHAPNATGLFDLNYFSTSTSAIYQAVGLTCPSGSLLNAVQNVVRRSNLNFGIDAWGKMWLRPHPSMISLNSRTTDKIPVRATLLPSDYSNIRWSRNEFMPSRRVDGAGFWYDSSNPTVAARPQPVRATAYGGTWSQGVSTETIPDALVQDQLDLNFRTGARQAVLNNPDGTISLDLPGHWDVFEPSWMSFVAVVVPSYLNPLGVERTIRCIPISYSERMGENGVVDSSLSLEPEAFGQPGITVDIKPKIDPPPPPPPPASGTDWEITWNFVSTSYDTIWVGTNGDETWMAGRGWMRGPGRPYDQMGLRVRYSQPSDGTARLTKVKFEAHHSYAHPVVSMNRPVSFTIVGGGIYQKPSGYPLPTGGIIDLSDLITDSTGFYLQQGGSNYIAVNFGVEHSVDADTDNDYVWIVSVTLGGKGVQPTFG